MGEDYGDAKNRRPYYIYEIRVKSWWVNAGDAFMNTALLKIFAVAMATHFPLETFKP